MKLEVIFILKILFHSQIKGQTGRENTTQSTRGSNEVRRRVYVKIFCRNCAFATICVKFTVSFNFEIEGKQILYSILVAPYSLLLKFCHLSTKYNSVLRTEQDSIQHKISFYKTCDFVFKCFASGAAHPQQCCWNLRLTKQRLDGSEPESTGFGIPKSGYTYAYA